LCWLRPRSDWENEGFIKLVFVGGDDLGRALLLALSLVEVGGFFCGETATFGFSSLYFTGDEDGAVDAEVDVDDDSSTGAEELVHSCYIEPDQAESSRYTARGGVALRRGGWRRKL